MLKRIHIPSVPSTEGATTAEMLFAKRVKSSVRASDIDT